MRNHNKSFITNIKDHQIFEVPSLEAIELLFPKWEYDKEKVVFTCGHDDDAVAGAAILINTLTKNYGADVHLLVSTDASNGFEPSKIIKAYPGMLEIIKREDENMPLEDVLSRIDNDYLYKQKISKIIHENMGEIRLGETIKGYKHIGVPEDNIYYFAHKKIKTIDDYSMKPYMALEMPDGSEGLYGWMIRKLREINATRVLSINLGDTHHDHYDTAITTVDMSQRAKSNLYHIGGRGAPIKNNAAGTHGLFYLTYETLPEGYGTMSKRKLVPTLGIIGSDEDVDIKKKALEEFKSQGGLVKVFDKMPDNHLEYFEYFPTKDRLIKEDNDYHTAHLKLLEDKTIKDITLKAMSNI